MEKGTPLYKLTENRYIIVQILHTTVQICIAVPVHLQFLDLHERNLKMSLDAPWLSCYVFGLLLSEQLTMPTRLDETKRKRM